MKSSARTPSTPCCRAGKSNLSDVAAAVGLGQLGAWRNSTHAAAQLVARYFELWGEGAPVRLPERGDEGHSWHVFTPLLPLPRLRISRAAVHRAMKERGIGVGVHYPAIHLFSGLPRAGLPATVSSPMPSGSGARP